MAWLGLEPHQLGAKLPTPCHTPGCSGGLRSHQLYWRQRRNTELISQGAWVRLPQPSGLEHRAASRRRSYTLGGNVRKCPETQN